MAQRDRGDQRAVGDLHAVEYLQPLPQAAQDRDRVLHRRLVHQHRLEPALQRRVLLDPLAVLIQRRRADQVQLAAGQHRLEHVARVHRALGRPGPDHGVQLVHEQQDVSLRCLDLGQDRLEPFLELAAVLGPRDQRGQVEAEDGPVPQPLGHVAAVDPLGQALHDRGLAHPRIADQDRVVLGLAGEDLDHPPDLGVTPDDRVEPARGGVGHQVSAVLVQRLVGSLGHRGPHPLVSSDLGQRLQKAVPGQPVGLQQPARGRRRALVEQRHDQVLHGDVLVLEPVRLLVGRIEQTGQPLRDVDLPRGDARAGDLGASGELGLERRPQLVRIGAGLGQQAGDDAVLLVEQGQQQVLAVHFAVPEAERPGLRLVQCFLRLLRQVTRVHVHLPGRRASRRAASSTSIRSSRSVTSPTAA